MRTLLCTAEPFGYGPSSSLAQIVSHMATLANSSSAHTAVYLGSGHTLDFARAIAAYGGRVEGCAIGEAAGRERFVARAREADAALIVTDFEAAAAVREAGIPFAIYDPLAWYWPTIPAICRDADLYLCQEFFGVRARLADAGMRNAIVIPPLTPEIESHGERSGILISLGGLGNPYFTAAKCVDYARAVLAALRRAIEGERGPITSLTSKQIAESLPGLDVATLPPDEVHRRIASASVCLLTPGLGQLYEASALGARVVWLPPANDSQGRQLRDVIARGMAPGAVDWHEFMDVPRVDYSADQAGVMRTLSSHMERLLADTRAQARLSACVRARMIAVREGPNPLARLAIENGRGGAVVAARILDNWVRSLGEPGVATRQLGDVAPPPQPRLGPLLVPRENRATDAAMIATIRTLHAEVDGTGFHTLAGALEVCREAREHAARPTAAGFRRALERWPANGLALWDKYRAGSCTSLAEVLRAKIQRVLGLSSQIICVRYADSKRPLDHAWEYDGTVHADLLVPFVDPGGVHAVHVVCGMGIGDHVHVLDGEAALLAHLDALGYARGAVVDPAELARTAFGTKDRLWIVEGPEVGEGSWKLGVDVIGGTLFLNRAAAARYRGPRPLACDPGTLSVPLDWAREGGARALVDAAGVVVRAASSTALRRVVDAVSADFAQPADFVENLMYLAANLDAWCAGTLCEPGRSLRRARGRAHGAMDEPSTIVIDVLAAADGGGGALPDVVPATPSTTPRALASRRLHDQLRALRGLPRSAIRARHAMAAEVVRLVAAVPRGPAPAAENGSDDDREPSVLDVVPSAVGDDTIQGVRFDTAKQAYVPARIPAVLVHALHLRLAQFLDWELETVSFDAGRALVERLVDDSVDPVTGVPLVDADRLGEIIAAIAHAAPADDPVLAPIAAARVDVWLSASHGGDDLDKIEWRIPPSTAAGLYALLDDAHTRSRLFAVAAAERTAAKAIVDAKRAALAAVLEHHRGVAHRHKRAHWALVNLASAGQTIAELRRVGGVLPREATSLEPASLRARYATTPRLALRFVLTDRFELNVLGDARYWDTIVRWGFPPNHETLAATRPILASGYLTIDRGRIVAIEDDGVMIPGKLAAGLPPIQEVLEALGFDVDLDRVAGASLVIDWDAFADAAAHASDPELEPWHGLDDVRVRDLLASRSHAERPALAAAWIRRVAATHDRETVVQRTAEVLRGFRLINVGGRAIASGDIPKGAEWIDVELARYLVRKVCR